MPATGLFDQKCRVAFFISNFVIMNIGRIGGISLIGWAVLSSVPHPVGLHFLSNGELTFLVEFKATAGQGRGYGLSIGIEFILK